MVCWFLVAHLNPLSALGWLVGEQKPPFLRIKGSGETLCGLKLVLPNHGHVVFDHSWHLVGLRIHLCRLGKSRRLSWTSCDGHEEQLCCFIAPCRTVLSVPLPLQKHFYCLCLAGLCCPRPLGCGLGFSPGVCPGNGEVGAHCIKWFSGGSNGASCKDWKVKCSTSVQQRSLQKAAESILQLINHPPWKGKCQFC